MADVFLSYKRDERSAIERIATRLRVLRLTVWFDASMSAGEAFSDEIDREARAAKVIIVCWSPSAFKSDWVKAEAQIGFKKKKLAACYVAGPDDFDAPTPYNALHTEDLREWLAAPTETHSGWKSVLRRVGKLCGRADIESWGELCATPADAELRSWIATNEASPLATIAHEMLRTRIEQEQERIRIEQDVRVQSEEREAKQRAREAEGLAKEEEARAWLRRADEEAEKKLAREEAERRRAQEERLAREKAERIARDEAERLAREEAERLARDEAERLAREEAERLARDEAERRAREEAERSARERTERLARLEIYRREQRGPSKLAWGLGIFGVIVLGNLTFVGLNMPYNTPNNNPNDSAATTALECSEESPSRASVLSEADASTFQGLEFENLAVARDFDRATPVLRVTGSVLNKTRSEIFVPRIQVALLSSDGAEVCLVVEAAARPTALAGNSARSFIIEIGNAPYSAVSLQTTFEGMPQDTNEGATGVVSPSELERAAQSGNPVAQYELALLRLGAGQTEDGIELLRSAADQGFAMAQYRLAKRYETGEGVVADLNLARRWTERAAASGNRRAMHDLGVYFARGEGGTTIDETAAFRWFSQAAELGVADSQYNLGVLYEQGRGVAVSRSDALLWYLVAARQGDQDAASHAASLQPQLSDDEVETVRARVAAFRPRPSSAVANGEFGSRPWE